MSAVPLPLPTTLARPGGVDATHAERAAPGSRGQLVDRFGRVHRDLRISLTDRCSLRCTYCMPEQGVEWLAKSSILTTDEIVRVAGVLASLGIVEVRLTTNGLKLPELAEPLREAGLARVNVSIDTLRRDRFAELTRRDRLDDVLSGIRAARRAGFAPLKLNAVPMRGVNDDEIVDLVQFAVDNGAQMRFIEQMPLDAGHTWSRSEMVDAGEILDKLTQRFTLTPIGERGSSPSQDYLVDGGPTTVGLIASVSAPFCGACDRVRLTADGQIRNCLFAREESDLLPLLRGAEGSSPADDDAIADLLRRSIAGKRAGHGIDDPGFLQPQRPMSAIGG